VLIASFHRAGAGGHVDEMEEVVVATRALPVADWRRAFGLGYFLAAAHNLRLLDVVLQVARRAAGGDRRIPVEGRCAAMGAAAPRAGSGAAPEGVWAGGDGVRASNAAGHLAGGERVSPAEGTGDHLWAVEDAVLHAALVAGGGFYDEVEAWARATFPGRAGAIVADAVRYQRFLTPAPGDRAPRAEGFAFDFDAWRARPDDPLAPRPTRPRFAPSPALAAAHDARAFMLGYLGAVHARAPTGTTTAA